jgi:hypothetical protein
LDDFIMFCCFELELDASSPQTLRAQSPAGRSNSKTEREMHMVRRNYAHGNSLDSLMAMRSYQQVHAF